MIYRIGGARQGKTFPKKDSFFRFSLDRGFGNPKSESHTYSFHPKSELDVSIHHIRFLFTTTHPLPLLSSRFPPRPQPSLQPPFYKTHSLSIHPSRLTKPRTSRVSPHPRSPSFPLLSPFHALPFPPPPLTRGLLCQTLPTHPHAELVRHTGKIGGGAEMGKVRDVLRMTSNDDDVDDDGTIEDRGLI